MLRFRQHGSVEKYVHEFEGHNYRMEEIQAGVLNVKMKYIEKWTQQRRNAAALYSKTLSSMGLNQVITPFHPDHVKPVYHLYIIRVQDREELMKFLDSNGVQTGLHYPYPLHETRAYESLGYVPEDFPVASKYAKEILSIPMFPEITDEMVLYVCEKIKEFYTK
jgi:dTDP-4-amino-4,6-dideoxygalactose transaminase